MPGARQIALVSQLDEPSTKPLVAVMRLSKVPEYVPKQAE